MTALYAFRNWRTRYALWREVNRNGEFEMKSNIRFFAFVFVCFLAFCVIARGQEVQVTGSHERVQGRAFVSVTERLSIGAQYGFENGRQGKHDAAALVKVDALKVRRLSVSPEVGFGVSRVAQHDTHHWQTKALASFCRLGALELCSNSPIPDGNQVIWNVQTTNHVEVNTRTPKLGTWIAGASARYRITNHLSAVGIYQRHGVNGFPQRNVWSVGASWSF